MSQELFSVLITLVTGAVILAIGFALGVSFGARVERKRMDDAERVTVVPPISPAERDRIEVEAQRKLAEAFTPGISERFRGPSFGRPRLITFHNSDYVNPMVCAVGPEETHLLRNGQKVYEIPVDIHDGQEGNVLLVCWEHGRPDEVLS